jgi:uncharacterized protein
MFNLLPLGYKTCQHGQYIIPVEIKSGEKGTLRSLHQFVNKANHPFALRLYAGPLKVEDTATSVGRQYTLFNLPYYLGARIPDYLQHLISQASAS